MAVNTLLERNAISLNASDTNHNSQDKAGYIFTDLAGKPSVINWFDAGFEELRISVWWDYDHSKHPQAYADFPDSDSNKEKFRTTQPLAKPQHYPKFVGVTFSFYLERKAGKWIQGKEDKFKGFDRYIRRGIQDQLDALPDVFPNGFKVSGPAFL